MRYAALLAVTLVLGAAVSGQPSLPVLDPMPEQITWANTSADPYLDAHRFQAILVEPNTWAAQLSIQKINDRLKQLGLAALPLRKMPEERLNEDYIWVSVEPTMRMPKLLHPLPVPAKGGYRLAVGDSMVYLLGQDLEGIQRGVTVLSQLLTQDGRVPKVLISDSPPGSAPRPHAELPEARLETGVNAQGFPLLRLQLEQYKHAIGSIEIRVPEAIEAWPKGQEASVLVYQDLRSPEWPAVLAAQPVSLPARWETSPAGSVFTLPLDNGCRLTAKAVWQAPRLSIEYTFLNGMPQPLSRIQAVTCVQLQGVSGLRDLKAQRTAVPLEGSGQYLYKLIPGFAPFPAEKADFQRLMAFTQASARLYSDNPHTAPHPGYPQDPGKVIHYWQTEALIDHPAIMEVASDQLWGVRVSSPQARCVWSNPGVTCLHADPVSGETAPGQETRLALEVELFQTTLAQMVR